MAGASQNPEKDPKDSYNKGGFIAFIFSMVFSLLFFVYIAVIHPGIDLKEVPDEGAATGLAEAGAAKTVDITKIDKPWEPNEDMATHGKKIFQQNCAMCHGNEGRGDGPAGKSLVPPPRDVVAGKWTRGGTSIALFTTVKEGLPGTSMVGFPSIPVKDRWAIVQWIRSVTENKVEDNAAELEKFAQQEK